MAFQSIALVLSMAISALTLVLLILQTRSLSQQTRSLARSLEYDGYLRLVDSLNEINRCLLTEPSVQEMFEDVGYIVSGIEAEGLTVGKLALAWYHFNRYEAAFVGFKQGILPESQWALWRRRLELDMAAPYLRAAWRIEEANYAYAPDFLDCMKQAVAKYTEVDGPTTSN